MFRRLDRLVWAADSDYCCQQPTSLTDSSYMTETIFPARQRCKKCRQKLDTIVLNGMYCSYKCVPHPEPAKTIEDTPRHCKRQVGERWDWKAKYRHEGEVPERLRLDPATNIYRCDNCLFLHVGHSRVAPADTEKLRRTVHDEVVLGSVIRRRREQLNWDKTRLAKDLKVPAIRITEIERGDKKVDISVLFKLLHRLKITVEMIER